MSVLARTVVPCASNPFGDALVLAIDRPDPVAGQGGHHLMPEWNAAAIVAVNHCLVVLLPQARLHQMDRQIASPEVWVHSERIPEPVAVRRPKRLVVVHIQVWHLFPNVDFGAQDIQQADQNGVGQVVGNIGDRIVQKEDGGLRTRVELDGPEHEMHHRIAGQVVQVPLEHSFPELCHVHLHFFVVALRAGHGIAGGPQLRIALHGIVEEESSVFLGYFAKHGYGCC
mmetsp:Transcript_141257/g.246299  ORF Transcript_141257/g.246299 Transcript_141257/m.246299 type:complete len:227 (-) Transcript_141257:785-1465(-)